MRKEISNIRKKQEGIKIMYKTVNLFYEPRKEIWDKLGLSVRPEMSEFDSAFLCGMLREFKPHKIMEVGIAGGVLQLSLCNVCI